jgi:hypothetical protein
MKKKRGRRRRKGRVEKQPKKGNWDHKD